MRRSLIRAGDIVLVNKRGRLFHAKVRGDAPDEALIVEPIERGISWRHVKPREIVDHWAHARRTTREAVPPPEQYSFDDLVG